MAGSIKDMIYLSDAGTPYVVSIDESNGEAAGFDDYNGEAGVAPLPKGLGMRYANVVEPVTGAKRKIYIGRTDTPIWEGTAISVLLFLVGITSPGNVAFSIASLVGESFRRPKAADTGLIDGDAT